MQPTQMKYLAPAQDWNECIPIGNGFLAGMISGKVDCDELYLNEDSYWYGGYRNRNNHDAKHYLQDVRDLVFNGEIPKAEALGMMSLGGLPESARHYLPAGVIHIHSELDAITDYARTLDLSRAVANTTFTANGVTHTRTYFASNPANLLVVRFTTDQEKSLSFRLDYSVERYIEHLRCTDDATLVRTAYSGGEDGVRLVNMIKIVSDGTVKGIGKNLLVEDASEATIYISLATSFRHSDPQQYCKETLARAMAKGYDALLAEHIQDYQRLFHTVRLDLKSKTDAQSTKDLLDNLADDTALNALTETYFNFGRYLLISCSRVGSLPANLQGIWNKEHLPKWDSKYTININTEMNYWPAELLNLSECHLPLFDLIQRMVPHGEQTAQEMYQCRGFMAHHNTDLWADTAPQDRSLSSTIWVLGGAWLCLHILDHYQFTNDLDFAAAQYPTLKKACQFILDFQVEHNGKLVICPSLSPENTYMLPDGTKGRMTYQAAMDGQIIATLFQGVIALSHTLAIGDDFAQLLQESMEKMPNPIALSADERIMEWVEDYAETELGHRHISHLFALYPSHLIGDDPVLCKAARKTLTTRLANGGGHTGWSMAWIINMWARLKDADEVYACLRNLFAHSTLPNLFDNHPPFQIDGNFGSIAGIGEALLQSHTKHITLLPALPTQWADGCIDGICARGNYQLSIAWENHTLTHCTIRSKNETPCHVLLQYKDQTQALSLAPMEEKHLSYEKGEFYHA